MGIGLLLEVVFKDIDRSIVVEVKKYVEDFSSKIPFESVVKVWKQEVYFSTPIKISVVQGELVYKVYRGGVYYWPPGDALCLFYGITQPYTPVIYIGNIVDPVQVLYPIREGIKVQVMQHYIDSRFKDIVQILRSLGYTVATPIRDDGKVVTAYKHRDGKRISFQVYVEDYGFHIESEGIIKFKEDDLTAYSRLIEVKNIMAGYARLDLSEEGYIIISATASNINEVSKAINDVEKSLENLEFLSKL